MDTVEPLTRRTRSGRRRRVAQLLAVTLAFASLASTGVADDLFARDGKAQHGMTTEYRDETRALAAAAMQMAPVDCTSGLAAGFPCQNVGLQSIVPVTLIGAELGSDIWGWTDPETGREIAISTTYTGMSFIDVTDPAAPLILGRVALPSFTSGLFWRDVKVHDNHAYLVAEEGGSGLTVFDLTRLRGVTVDQGLFTADANLQDFSSAHNIHINNASATAYVVGSTECAGGLLMYDLTDPGAPVQSGCFDEDGYVHDVECVIYDGPDTEHVGSEICFASNEDTVTIVDVTDKSAPKMLARHGYPTAAYTHQGDVTPDHEWFIFGDEGDESSGTVDSTATYIVNVADLDNPGEVLTYLHPTAAIDHNLYLHDGYVWQTNYVEGLQVLDYDVATLGEGTLERVAFFDVIPVVDVAQFAGGWSAYVEFPSRNVVVNVSEIGMFVLEPTIEPQLEDVVSEPEPEPEPEPAPEPTAEPEPAPEAEPAGTDLPATGGGLVVLAGLAMAGAGALGLRRR